MIAKINSLILQLAIALKLVDQVINGQSQAESLTKFFNDHYSGLSLTALDFIK